MAHCVTSPATIFLHVVWQTNDERVTEIPVASPGCIAHLLAHQVLSIFVVIADWIEPISIQLINLYIIFWLQQTSHNYICCTLCYNEVRLSAGQPFLNTVNCGCGWADIRYSGFFNYEHCNCEMVVHAARLPHIVEPTYRFPPLFNITKIGVCHCLSLQMRHHWLWQVHELFLV